MKNILLKSAYVILALSCITVLIWKIDYFKFSFLNLDSFHSFNDLSLALPFGYLFVLLSGILISIGLIQNEPKTYFKSIIECLKHLLLVFMIIVFLGALLIYFCCGILLSFPLFIILALILGAGVSILMFLMLSIDEAWQFS
jgi:hypothetical protein